MNYNVQHRRGTIGPRSTSQKKIRSGFGKIHFVTFFILVAFSVAGLQMTIKFQAANEAYNIKMAKVDAELIAMSNAVISLQADKEELMNVFKIRGEEQESSAIAIKGLRERIQHDEAETNEIQTQLGAEAVKIIHLKQAVLDIEHKAAHADKNPPPAISNNASVEKCQKKKCALLFFGLIQNGFQEFILPSIERNILSVNPDCDVFLHTYNITSVPKNVASRETRESTIHAEDAYLLTDKDHIKMETVEDFWAVREEVVNETKEHHCQHWGECCTSHINMIKQWHSINSVWDLMVEHEESKGEEVDENNYYYEQIGLFRSDVYYITPVSIYEHQAGVPDFAHYGGINDRLFYGKREYASLWAHRFDFIEDFDRLYLEKKTCYHAESFVNGILETNEVPVEKNENICIWRVRSGSRVSLKDCQFREPDQEMTSVSTIEYLPVGYKISEGKRGDLPKIVRDEAVEKEESGDLVWPTDPVLDERREILLAAQSDDSCL